MPKIRGGGANPCISEGQGRSLDPLESSSVFYSGSTFVRSSNASGRVQCVLQWKLCCPELNGREGGGVGRTWLTETVRSFRRPAGDYFHAKHAGLDEKHTHGTKGWSGGVSEQHRSGCIVPQSNLRSETVGRVTNKPSSRPGTLSLISHVTWSLLV